MSNPKLGAAWRKCVVNNLDRALELWCQAENKRKRARRSDEFNGHNVLNGIPDWYSNPRGLSQFLINNPPDSETEDEEDRLDGLPRFGLMKHLKHTVVVPPIEICLGPIEFEPKIADYSGSPGTPRKQDFCVDAIQRRELMNADDHLPSSPSASMYSDFSKSNAI